MCGNLLAFAADQAAIKDVIKTGEHALFIQSKKNTLNSPPPAKRPGDPLILLNSNGGGGSRDLVGAPS